MKMYFISGVSGVGKTSVMEILKRDSSERYSVKDFDERGVPAGGGREWRLNETRHWILEGKKLAQVEKLLIVCGLANPEEIALMEQAKELSVQIILLDAPGEIIAERLYKRNFNKKAKDGLEKAVGSIEAFIKSSSDFAPILKNICITAGVPVIDTSTISPEEVAVRVKELL